MIVSGTTTNMQVTILTTTFVVETTTSMQTTIFTIIIVLGTTTDKTAIDPTILTTITDMATIIEIGDLILMIIFQQTQTILGTIIIVTPEIVTEDQIGTVIRMDRETSTAG